VAAQQQYVGIDLHRRRSVIVRKDATGHTLETVHIDNDPVTLAEVLARAGEAPEVVLEACYGWDWAADVLAEIGRMCIWLTRWGTAGGTGGSRTTNATPTT
jgi:hypothetical protein